MAKKLRFGESTWETSISRDHKTGRQVLTLSVLRKYRIPEGERGEAVKVSRKDALKLARIMLDFATAS